MKLVTILKITFGAGVIAGAAGLTIVSMGTKGTVKAVRTLWDKHKAKEKLDG